MATTQPQQSTTDAVQINDPVDAILHTAAVNLYEQIKRTYDDTATDATIVVKNIKDNTDHVKLRVKNATVSTEILRQTIPDSVNWHRLISHKSGNATVYLTNDE
jgi:methylaspartate ammonia-lyase